MAEKKKPATAKSTEQPLQAIPETMKIEQVERQRIVVTAGREVYAPIPYHTFEVGPLTVDMEIDPVEGASEAQERGLEILDGLFTRQFESKMAGFFERLNRVDEYMVEVGRTPRTQQEMYGKGSSTPRPRDERPLNNQDNQSEPANEAGWRGDPRKGEAQSGAQAGMMERKAQEAGLDLTAECERIFDAQPHELCRRAASKLIDWLIDKAKQGGPGAATGAQTANREPVKYGDGGADPVAKSLGDMVTAKQLGMLKAIAREGNVDADAECGKTMGCAVSELSKRAASDFIDHLRNIKEAGVYDQSRPDEFSGPPQEYGPGPQPVNDEEIPF